MTNFPNYRRLAALASRILLSTTLCATSVCAFAQNDSIACGTLRSPGQYGPYDYRTIPGESKYLVEMAHFTPKVENLIAGNTGTLPSGDLDYTLRAIPNHPRALLSMSRYSTKIKSERIPGARYPMECYFERAMRMAPDDPMPHLIYASYFKDRNKLAEAKKQLGEAERLRGDPGNSDFDYNLGLLYYDLGDYDKAAVAARRAYALGAPFPALMNKLKAVKRWPKATPRRRRRRSARLLLQSRQ